MWSVLCKNFFQRYVKKDAVVLDLAAGYCEFINNITAKRKIAVDLNEDIRKFANDDVEVLLSKSDDLSALEDSSVDVIFVSNFFEHLQNREVLFSTLSECNRVLKPGGGGVLLILQPNIRFAYREYWDFIDHVLPLSDKSLAEALILKGFSIDKMIPRFLPYSTKSGLPVNSFLVKWYLRLPFAWRIFGKQCFVAASKSGKADNA
jgi:ubiquinone/menaquinone biosynthesis C-methylase UbiE